MTEHRAVVSGDLRWDWGVTSQETHEKHFGGLMTLFGFLIVVVVPQTHKPIHVLHSCTTHHQNMLILLYFHFKIRF